LESAATLFGRALQGRPPEILNLNSSPDAACRPFLCRNVLANDCRAGPATGEDNSPLSGGAVVFRPAASLGRDFPEIPSCNLDTVLFDLGPEDFVY
jgi:hypothetical protein